MQASQHPQQPQYPQPQAAQQNFGYPPATSYAAGYPQPTGYPVRPPNKNPGHPLLTLLMLAIALFALIIIFKTFSSLLNPEPAPPPVPTQTTTAPTTQPTTTTPTTPPTTPTTPGSGYANDNYVVPDPDHNPPELPSPDTYNQATEMMQYNMVYNQRLVSPVRCDLIPIDPSTATKSQMQTYLDDITACLMRVWSPSLESAGYYSARPPVVVYSGSGQSACGKLERQNAFYCAGDQQIYYSMDLPTLLPKYQHDPILPLQIMAHEYGHAIQAQTGILWSESAWQQSYTDSHDTSSANQVSRRTEMQADCFAGAFVTSVAQSAGISSDEQQTMQAIMLQLGDDAVSGIPGYSADHGLGKNRQLWFSVGLTGSTMGDCNTFAPDLPSSKIK